MRLGVENGRFQLVYFTPEMLLGNKKWRQLILSENYQNRIKGLAVDEAHTIKKW